MKWLKGIGLFLVANFLIYLTLSITANILINVVLPAFGIDVRGVFSQQLLVWSLVIGFGGAFLSLAFSKQAARAMLRLYQITSLGTMRSRWSMVQSRKLPSVCIFRGQKSGCMNRRIPMHLQQDRRKQRDGGRLQRPVEQSQGIGGQSGFSPRNGACVQWGYVHHHRTRRFTMNTFVHYISNFVYQFIGQPQDREEGQAGNPMLAFVVYIVLQIVLSFLAMMVVSWHSRRREFAADAFSAKVYGRDSMIAALQSIDRWVNRTQFEYTSRDSLATMKISGKSSGLTHLFATHPPIEERIAALQRV